MPSIRADEAGLANALDRLAVLTLSAANDRSEDHHPRAGRPGEERFQDLLRRLLADGRAALVTGRFAQSSVEQPQVVVDLGDGGHRAAGIVAAGPLIDGDGWLQALDQIDVGPFELMEELPGVGREAFDILPLSFGIERVEGQRALARSARAGNDDQPIAGQGQFEVLQVVRAGPVDADAVRCLGPVGTNFVVHYLIYSLYTAVVVMSQEDLSAMNRAIDLRVYDAMV